jgi:hypothetical protein
MKGSRFAVGNEENENEEQEWERGEFGEAFGLVVGLPGSG